MADTTVPSFVSSLAQPYIDYIQGQVGGLTFLPSAARANIAAQISGDSGASGSSGQGAPSVQDSASDDSDSGADSAASGAAVGAAYGQSYFAYIQDQVEGLTFLPSEARSNISALISGDSDASGSSGQGAPPVHDSASAASDTGAAAGAASGANAGFAYAQPTIDYIRGQIESILPASVANSITAGFPTGSSSSGGSAAESSVPAGVRSFLVPNAELRNFLSTLGDQSS